MTRDQLDRYLRILGVEARPPGLDALAELVMAHLERAPFENVSKLYRFRRNGLTAVPGLDEYLDGIEHLRLGGTCYANGVHLNELLVTLGYRAKLCGADMSEPDVHVVNVVEIEGREFLVDVGYGAPFFAPMPLDAQDAHVVQGTDEQYVLRPRDEEGRSSLEHHRGGVLHHGYTFRPVPRAPAHFERVVADSFRPVAWFMRRITFIRFSPGQTLTLRNLSITGTRDGAADRRALAGRGELPNAIEILFGVPRRITEEALAVLDELGWDPAA